MRFMRIVTAVAATMLFVSGCLKPLDMKALPEVRNPVLDVSSDPGEVFMAGFAKESITPDTNQWMAGYDFLRRSSGVHDGLYARALVIKQGEEKLALVALDLVGLNRPDVMDIKALIKGFRPDQVLIHCTHVHAGPDTMGLWGLPPFYSGRDEEYMEKVAAGVKRAVEEAEADVRPADAWTAVYQMDPSLMYNMNEGEPVDNTMGIMVFRDKSGKAIATLINVNGHPEVMYGNNKKISADFPGVTCRKVEERYGGGAVLFNGALGSLITPRIPYKENREDHDFDDVEWFGTRVADEVERGMGLLVKEERPFMVHRMSLISFPVTNPVHKLTQRAGLLERDVYEGLRAMTEVNVIEIGSAQFVTFPGEAYPKQGLVIRAAQKPNSFQIGLVDDELGYILYPGDYESELYKYEAGLCPGPDFSVEMEKALMELLER